ncbi:hypothetical protein EIMP300_80200 [Escherichia coli]|uniref:Hypoxanthine phosphoribosyltransferase n=1 Tax=Escherichia coli TaxID=562 RepID=A0A8S0G421_ECOLX|nr:hypothetical protein EIMP300_80200 [Escherichia coli]
MKHTVEVMIPEAEIKARIAELGRQITERYKDSGSDMVLVGLLRGSFMFMADLCREVQVSHEVVLLQYVSAMIYRNRSTL